MIDQTAAILALQLAVGRSPAHRGATTDDVLKEAEAFYVFLTSPKPTEN